MPDLFNFDHVMTVARLRDALAPLPDDMPVILQKDAEGNGYSPLAEANQAMYLPESTWAGDVYPTPEDMPRLIEIDPGYAESEPPDEAVRALLLGPVN